MNAAFNRKGNLIFGFVLGILLLLQMACLVFYGSRKAGFHEDELYTYYSSNKTAGLPVRDREWMEREELRNDFVALPGEQFRYQVVKQMQSWDVHPPVYYYIFHTACSFFPGKFNKWLGIGVNLAAYVVSYLLLAYGVCMAVQTEKGRDCGQRGRILAVLTCLAWGFSGAVISGVLFIRMYQWLTLFILLCMDLHLRAIKKQDFRIRSFFLPLGMTVFLGFLTQYYYIIFHFFLGSGFCFLLLKNKKKKELLAYVLTCGAGLALALGYYPASLSHIFRGYRGTEAVSEFGNVSNTWGRLWFFYGLFDDYVMNGTLSWWLLLLCLLVVTTGYLRKRKKEKPDGMGECAGLLLFACAGYFFTVSKTALILGETSNRYQLPIYGILLFLILYGVWMLAEGLALSVRSVWETPGRETAGKRQIMGVLTIAAILAVVFMDGAALKNGRVFFLYEEEKEIMEFVKAHSKEPVVVFYHDASSDKIWWLSDELMEYERFYLASQGNQELITDEAITESERLLVYVADYENKEACLEGLLKVNDRLTGYQEAAKKGLWTLYEMK